MAKEFSDIHAIIGQVAQDYKYKTVQVPNWLSKYWDKFLVLCGRWLSWFFTKVIKLLSSLSVPLVGSGDSGKTRILIFLGSFLCMAIALVIWQQRRLMKHGSAVQSSIDMINSVAQPRTSLEWKQQANEFKEKGLYREACRSLHRACLQMLDEAKLITFAPARSNYEYMRVLNKLPEIANMQSRQNLNKLFKSFSNTVDAIYFGNRNAGEAEFELCLKWLQEIESCLTT